MENYTLKVDRDNSGLRLDVFLARHLPNVPSRNFVQQLIESGQVRVNQKQAKSRHHLNVDDEIAVSISDEPLEDCDLQPEDIPLDIFYEDDDLLVVNKPVGMLVHPVRGVYGGTLANALLHHCRTLSDVNAPSRPGIVHRLDRETSGLIVAAKNNRAHVRLARQFEKHRVFKQYLALVEGLVEFDEGVVDASLGRHPRHHDKKAVAVTDNAKHAKTFYRVLKRFKNTTFVALFPKTGRTHQLRVHMAHLGHPILGDDKYGQKETFPRLALHAQAIGFSHPTLLTYIEFSTVPPPEFIRLRSDSLSELRRIPQEFPPKKADMLRCQAPLKGVNYA